MNKQNFERNIISIYGDLGRSWLETWPQRIRGISAKWGLSGLMPVYNMLYNYVASGLRGATPIVPAA